MFAGASAPSAPGGWNCASRSVVRNEVQYGNRCRKPHTLPDLHINPPDGYFSRIRMRTTPFASTYSRLLSQTNSTIS